MTRATVVLPVPGGPRNTKCRIGLSVVYPATARRRAASIDAAIERTCSLTPSSPIIASSSAIASSMVICGFGRGGAAGCWSRAARSAYACATPCARGPYPGRWPPMAPG